jgi:AraC-like DNA-binding protein
MKQARIILLYGYFLLFLLTSFLIFGATQFQLFPLEKAFAFVGITLGVMLVAFGFYGFRQTSIFSNTHSIQNIQNKGDKLSTQNSNYAKSGLTSYKIQILAEKLSKVMETKKPFLNENLNLTLLAELSETTQTQLSQVINQYFQMNFYDFVNQYRVEEAKRMLSSITFDHLTILGIAFECGFKSKSSFNRYFKKYVGVSPSEFKDSLR